MDESRRVLGGVKSGVGGLWRFGGVFGVGDSAVSPLPKYCAGMGFSFEDCRECAGGVGGRSGWPMRFEECFSVRGLDVYEFEGEVASVSSVSP